LKNAVEALNKGADAYLMKPVRPEDLLRTIQEKLEEQRQNEDMTEDRISAFLKTRTKQLLQKIQ
jgi:DNA-binding response OmpR family regulator